MQDVALGLHVRTCRKLEQAKLLAAAGQADGAETICRSVFESFLSQAFVCRQSVRLRRVNGKPVKKFDKKLPQEFRATLFLARDTMQQEARIDKMEKVPTLTRAARAERKAAKPAFDSIRKHIGDGWADAIKQNSCGGLPIADFAFSFGLSTYKYYRTVYSFLSEHVHPGEPSRFLTYVEDNTVPSVSWHDGNPEVERALWCTICAAGLEMSEFARLLDRSHKPYIKLGLFKNSYSEIKTVFKNMYTT